MRSSLLVNNRGGNIPWEKCCESFKNTTLDRAVWREQVAGIFPLLMEVTAISSRSSLKKRVKSGKIHALIQLNPGKSWMFFTREVHWGDYQKSFTSFCKISGFHEISWRIWSLSMFAM